MNALKPIVGNIMRAMPLVAVLGRPNSRVAIKSTPPVSRTAAPTTNSTPTVIMPSFDMPASASPGVRMPHNSNSATAPIRIDVGRDLA